MLDGGDKDSMGAVQLKWYRLESTESGDWALSISKCDDFRSLIREALSGLDHIGLRTSKTKPWVCYTYVKNADDAQIESLRDFLDLLGEILLVRRSAALASGFEDELSYCAALAFNRDEPTATKRTEVGQLEYRAKYKHDAEALKALTKRAADVAARHIVLRDVDYVAAMPGSTDTTHVDVAKAVGTSVAKRLGAAITVIEKVPTGPLKGLAVGKRLEALEDAMDFDDEVDAQRVLIVDDLYQSGTSIWTAARAARAAGATAVYGLACVKSLRDTDNT